MRTAIEEFLSRLNRLAGERTLGRSIVLLLVAAILLLLVVNLSTFVLINRTADFSAKVESHWQTRRAGRLLLINLQDAETSQRGYLLTGRDSLMRSYLTAIDVHEAAVQDLEDRLGSDAAGQAGVEAIRRLSRDKILEMSRVLDLYRQGRSAEAVALVRGGRGQELMRELETQLDDIDQQIGLDIADSREQSEGSAAVTLFTNALAGLLILVLAGIAFLLVRRYLAELKAAQAALDRTNAGLEETVRARTAALTRANEEVQRFAYIVSHDLRSPLVNVMGYTAELEQAGKTIDLQMTKVETLAPGLVEREALTAAREDIPEAVGFIRASTEKMDRLIGAILKLSREGRRNLIPETLDVAAMVRRIADSISHQVEQADGEVLVADLPEFESDRLSVEQILGNLIDNAVKYLDPKRPGRIEVTGRDVPGGWVEYAVTDNGRGISDRDHERIFELFRRSGRQDRPGEGLGLAFVRNSVRRLGGDVTVESVLGEGSTFRLKFPKRLILDEAGDTV